MDPFSGSFCPLELALPKVQPTATAAIIRTHMSVIAAVLGFFAMRVTRSLIPRLPPIMVVAAQNSAEALLPDTVRSMSVLP